MGFNMNLNKTKLIVLNNGNHYLMWQYYKLAMNDTLFTLDLSGQNIIDDNLLFHKINLVLHILRDLSHWQLSVLSMIFIHQK